MKRACGVLLPVSSLASRYGIGCFSDEAYRFVDFLVSAKQSYWQMLPMGQTGFGDSPYQSCSVFAGNPYFIDLEVLIRKGYLTREEVDACDFGSDPYAVDYGKIYAVRYRLLRKAYHNSPFAWGADVPADEIQAKVSADAAPAVECRTEADACPDEPAAAGETLKEEREATPAEELAAFEAFIAAEEDWLDDYALFCTIKMIQGSRDHSEWRPALRAHSAASMAGIRERHADEYRFWQFLQFEFDRQFRALKAYANERGVQIIGDMPIYAAADSADVWSHPELFDVDENGVPNEVAGCPPDAFTDDGQLWGNPLYNWEVHEQSGYAWWISRLGHAMRYFDVVRIDHFRGFESYYAVPYGAENAKQGVWHKGPGMKLFGVVNERFGRERIIAEDLGFITDEVRQLLKDSGYPGMKVLQFAFDGAHDSEYLPHSYTHNCVAYSGTHDNETLLGWYDGSSEPVRSQIDAYLAVTEEGGIRDAAIRALMMSSADTVIIPMQDYLGLGNEARINVPSVSGGKNWCWRVDYWALTADVSDYMRKFAGTYFRQL